jgi:hypothetical protein
MSHLTDIALAAWLALVISLPLGYWIGVRKGKSIGWCEHHFQDIAREKARRDRRGRFRSLKNRNQTTDTTGELIK